MSLGKLLGQDDPAHLGSYIDMGYGRRAVPVSKLASELAHCLRSGGGDQRLLPVLDMAARRGCYSDSLEPRICSLSKRKAELGGSVFFSPTVTATTAAPSPTAAAARLVEPARTSPMASGYRTALRPPG